jgi:transposase
MTFKPKLNKEQIHAIHQLHKDGNSSRNIGKLVGISHITVQRIIKDMQPKDENVSKQIKSEVTKIANKVIDKKTAEVIEKIAIATTQAEVETISHRAYNEEYMRMKEEFEKLVSLATTNHKNAVVIASNLLGRLNKIVSKPEHRMSVAEIKRAMEVLESSANTMDTLFTNLGYDLRSEIIQKNIVKSEEKNLPLFSFVNSKGEVVDVFDGDIKDEPTGDE